MIRVGVVGATGYVGSEVVRLLLAHPGIEVCEVTSTSRAGSSLTAAVPGLLGLTDLVLQPIDPSALSTLDAVVMATPHGAARAIAADLQTPVVVDCSSDHRHVRGWQYGQPEWRAEQLRGAERVAAAGCFATAISLAVAPFVASGTNKGPIRVVAATGSTGSGAAPRAGTHHPERFMNLRAYKVLAHQHVPEIRALLAEIGDAPPIRFVPLSAPVDRGIFATAFLDVEPGLDATAVLADAYAGSRFVRLREGTPELRYVRGTAFCDLSVHVDEGQVVVLSAIDNLGKGAAGQAIQCLNLALGLPVETGLLTPSLTP
jgi:N-acetyl-gamma-glutamyl-phosphate reductase